MVMNHKFIDHGKSGAITIILLFSYVPFYCLVSLMSGAKANHGDMGTVNWTRRSPGMKQDMRRSVRLLRDVARFISLFV